MSWSGFTFQVESMCALVQCVVWWRRWDGHGGYVLGELLGNYILNPLDHPTTALLPQISNFLELILPHPNIIENNKTSK